MKIFVNILTLFRILATFFLPFIWRILNPLGIIIFVGLVLLTDFFDGFLARKFHVQSLFGSIMDTVADKIFGIVMLLIVAIYFKEYYIVAILEIIIAVINVLATINGVNVKSSFLGKTKMWILGLSTIFALIVIFSENLLNINLISSILEYIIQNKYPLIISCAYLTSGCEIMVIIDYTRNAIKELKSNSRITKYQFKSSDNLRIVLFDTDYFLNNKDIPLSKHLLK